MWRGAPVSCRPPGPPRLRGGVVRPPVTSFRCLATMWAEPGLWIQPALPCWSDSLLLASDHDRPSGSMQSLNIFLYHSTVCTVPGEVIFTGFPSLSPSRPPNDHSPGPAVEIES